MSIQAVGWVLDHSESRGVTRLVLISLANHANQDAVCWPAQRTVAREAGVALGTVSQALARLVEIGEVEVVDKGGPQRSATYRLVHVVNAARAPGVNAARAPGVVQNRNEPSGTFRRSYPQVRGDSVAHARAGQSNASGKEHPTGRFSGELAPVKHAKDEKPNPDGKGKPTEILNALRERNEKTTQ